MRAVRSAPLQGGSHRHQGSVVSKPGQESRRCHRTLAGADPQRHTAPGAVQTHASDTVVATPTDTARSEEHTSELQSLMRISYAVFCLKKKTIDRKKITT